MTCLWAKPARERGFFQAPQQMGEAAAEPCGPTKRWVALEAVGVLAEEANCDEFTVPIAEKGVTIPWRAWEGIIPQILNVYASP